MRIFFLVIIGAIIIGGLAGGQATGTTFSILWATLIGVGVFAILMGLGALFHRQEEKRKKASNLTPEMRGVFDRMLGKSQNSGPDIHSNPSSDNRVLLNAVQGLIDQDIQDLKAGKTPERRLIPHHAIKRDIIIKAFEEDFKNLSPNMQNINKDHFQSQLNDIRQWDQHKLDEILKVMKQERGDLKELERKVRSEKSLYSIVNPLFS